MEQKYTARGLEVIGIHTPEFDYEKSRQRVEQAAARFQLKQPIYLDNDYAYWNALDNHYWPAFYLVDRRGNIRATDVGELHLNTSKGDAFEAKLEALLAEKAS
jgi:hypothetical protein